MWSDVTRDRKRCRGRALSGLRPRRTSRVTEHSHLQIARRRQRPDQAVLRLVLERRRPALQTPERSKDQDKHRRNHHLEGQSRRRYPRNTRGIANNHYNGPNRFFRAGTRPRTWRGTGWGETRSTRRQPSQTWENIYSGRGDCPCTTSQSQLQSKSLSVRH